ncbi:hypothetical protein PENTCL1PPCAC_15882 [Pristionchus entomophagus]|uniref:Uncharacterized protein n=1 Tax=Pristionchus entomophagus TaxID=358040 RepID=A0AAV5THG3_9BILA|nr:hypothetical protein PENTCL1PPCAC_15882 [Pristionchus entomophagus]
MRSLPVLFLVLALLPLSDAALKCNVHGWGVAGVNVPTDCTDATHCYSFQVADKLELNCDNKPGSMPHRCTAAGCTTDTAFAGNAADAAKGKGTLCCCDTDKCDPMAPLMTTLAPTTSDPAPGPTTPIPDPTSTTSGSDSGSGPVGLSLLPLAAVAAMAAAH